MSKFSEFDQMFQSSHIAECGAAYQEADGDTGYELSWGPGASSRICEIDIGEEEVRVITQDVSPK